MRGRPSAALRGSWSTMDGRRCWALLHRSVRSALEGGGWGPSLAHACHLSAGCNWWQGLPVRRGTAGRACPPCTRDANWGRRKEDVDVVLLSISRGGMDARAVSPPCVRLFMRNRLVSYTYRVVGAGHERNNRIQTLHMLACVQGALYGVLSGCRFKQQDLPLYELPCRLLRLRGCDDCPRIRQGANHCSSRRSSIRRCLRARLQIRESTPELHNCVQLVLHTRESSGERMESLLLSRVPITRGCWSSGPLGGRPRQCYSQATRSASRVRSWSQRRTSYDMLHFATNVMNSLRVSDAGQAA